MPDKTKTRMRMAALDINQKELAKRANMIESHVSKILRDGTDVRESTLKKLCHALGCKAEDIW